MKRVFGRRGATLAVGVVACLVLASDSALRLNVGFLTDAAPT